MTFDMAPAIARAQSVVNGLIGAIPSVGLALLVFGLFYFAALSVKVFVARVTETRWHAHRNAGIAIGRLAQGLVIFVGLLVALSVALPTFKPGDVVQVLGISSVAIGFAFRDILQNFLAGLLLLITQPFRIGDQIVASGYEGTVEEIQTRATFIRTYDGRRVILESLQGVAGVLAEPPPDVLVVDFASAAVNLRARWWIAPPEQADALDSRDQVLTAIRAALLAHGIDMPFPTQQVLFHDQTEESDGDRLRQREGWPPPRRGE